MINRIIILFFTFFIIAEYKSQDYLPKDTIYGNVKNIREKVVFLTKKENPQLLYYDDYGHSGFLGPEYTISRFREIWFTQDFCYYLNYSRTFDKKGNIISDVWYGKKDNFRNSYRKIFNKDNKIIKEIDSSNYSYRTTHYYYPDSDIVNIFTINDKGNYFRHSYKKYDNGKLKVLKEFKPSGYVDEYNYFYNKNGKLEYRIYKDPNSWRRNEDGSLSYGVLDTTLTVYKDIVNTYDEKNRILKHQTYDLYRADIDLKKPKLTLQIDYLYENDHLVSTSKRHNDDDATVNYFKYNKTGKIAEWYCCDNDIKKATIIKKFKYKDDKIISTVLIWKGEIQNITFRYKFDSKNNWTEIIKNVNGKDLYKWIRKIEYY